MTQLQMVRFILMIFITLVLTIVPLPMVISAFRPPWVLLFILYIQFYMPIHFSVASVLILGLFLDVMLSAHIGVHAFALLLSTWFASGKTQRFHFFSMAQQMMLVGVFCFINQLIIMLIDAPLGLSHGIIVAGLTAVISIMVWPWIKFIADTIFKLNRCMEQRAGMV
jgi:rod shape-determining protein MreD